MTDSLFRLTGKYLYLFWEGPSPGFPTHTCFAPGELKVQCTDTLELNFYLFIY